MASCSSPKYITSSAFPTPDSCCYLQRATQFLKRAREVFPDDGPKEESFSHFGQLMLPFHGAIIRELSNREKGRSSEPAPTSGGDRPWVLSCVKPEEYEAMASLLSKHDLLDALPQYLEDVRNTMIAMQKFERKMLSEPRQLFNRSQFILCRYRYGQQSLEDTHSQLKSLFQDRVDLLGAVEEVLGMSCGGESASVPSSPPSLSPSNESDSPRPDLADPSEA
ncbi:uncharacterized protein EI90DRAFT_3058563 [Cantharellus anzutake]|uniref:uncharacterized protein n=1 Tax=Cantharellus anzutake TaxID=1750568 RepID=UPI0019070429|nr:uncharacterized protein EI90DRAFT_3058563 [Cantharellus anzutake]KAF8331102.1 hypothetical protein EI90DRAFT_3058563 [Cantharellus anzutake]